MFLNILSCKNWRGTGEMLFEVGIMDCYESCYCIKFMKKLDEGQRL